MEESIFLKISDRDRGVPTLNLSEEDQVRHLHYLSQKFSTENQRLRRGQIKESAFASKYSSPFEFKQN